MRLVLWMALNDRQPCSTETTSYCEARGRLPLKVIVRLVHATAEKIEAGASDDWPWKGRRVSLVDGTTASMPDTPRNQRAFPQANTQGIGLGFPIVRLAVEDHLVTWAKPQRPDWMDEIN
jgi:hypothetical protein